MVENYPAIRPLLRNVLEGWPALSHTACHMSVDSALKDIGRPNIRGGSMLLSYVNGSSCYPMIECATCWPEMKKGCLRNPLFYFKIWLRLLGSNQRPAD